jgi:hypothetical protein
MEFKIVGAVRDIETIAAGAAVRTRAYLWKRFGRGNSRKMKGSTVVRYPDGSIWRVELHWYEAHGIGKRLVKIKKRLQRL